MAGNDTGRGDADKLQLVMQSLEKVQQDITYTWAALQASRSTLSAVITNLRTNNLLDLDHMKSFTSALALSALETRETQPTMSIALTREASDLRQLLSTFESANDK